MSRCPPPLEATLQWVMRGLGLGSRGGGKRQKGGRAAHVDQGPGDFCLCIFCYYPTLSHKEFKMTYKNAYSK